MASRHSLMENLAVNLEALHILESNRDGLRFSPPDGFRRSPVPRYLFRVCSPNSAGRTTLDVVESASAASSYHASRTCLFRMDDPTLAADMVSKHLRSLLAALVYVFYRRARCSERLRDISVFVVDTWAFREDTFARDLDLIRAFARHDGGDLANLAGLRRRRRHGRWAGSYAFGEYLTQGALSLAGRCARVTAQDMVDCGLLELHPRFAEFARWAKGDEAWADLVIELREPFYTRPASSASAAGGRRVFPNDAQIMSRIGNLFGVGWRAPIAVALLSLAPNRTGAVELLLNFGLLGQVWDPTKEACLDSATGVDPDNTLPEVAEFIYNLNDSYLEFAEVGVRSYIDQVAETLDAAQRLISKADKVRQPPRDFAATARRSSLFRLVRALSELAHHALPEENVTGVVTSASSDECTSDETGRGAWSL
ncbi:hypothetical protein IF1G_08214 [Cordyceps javanica]|uniref:Uncharacterized protein n=1 Tax=Cordyceps javanica TaxID=43265 RepID=A0A545UTW7_9HYPO|nr:hypothetical protein IF1G_08214 [Cordyceps javanica]TQW04809.1 hypothetical protein IF2G_07452 [Cordyceps javanica]